MNWEFSGVQTRFRKGRGSQIKLWTRWIIGKKTREFQKNIYFCFIDYAKAFVWITTNCGKFLEIGIREHLTCLLRNLYAGQAATVRTRHGTTEWNTFTFHVKAVYCHPAYLTYMQSTSWETLSWKKLESRLPGEISITSDMQMTPPLWQKVKTKDPLVKVKEESENVAFKVNI